MTIFFFTCNGARTNNCVNWALWESVVDNKSYNLYGHFGGEHCLVNMPFYEKGMCMRAQCHGLSLIVFSFPFLGWMDEEVGCKIPKEKQTLNKLQGPYIPLLQELGFRVGFKRRRGRRRRLGVGFRGAHHHKRNKPKQTPRSIYALTLRAKLEGRI